jgi:hypothetical protein
MLPVWIGPPEHHDQQRVLNHQVFDQPNQLKSQFLVSQQHTYYLLRQYQNAYLLSRDNYLYGQRPANLPVFKTRDRGERGAGILSVEDAEALPTMGLQNVPRCQHLKVNGVQCGSPALRSKRHCYFHERVQYEREQVAEDKSQHRKFGFPLLEDANSIQVALMKVIQMLGSELIDHKTAALMLYGLQTASANLRNAKFEPEKPSEVVIDEDTVDLTRIDGMQWSARDFKEETKPENENTHPLTKQEPASPEGTAVAATLPEDVQDLARRREQKRKLPESADGHEESPLTRLLLDRLIPGWEEREAEQTNTAAATATPS